MSSNEEPEGDFSHVQAQFLTADVAGGDVDLGPMLRDGGAGVAFMMAGLGALKFFWSATSSVTRVPQALERGAKALEQQAAAAEQAASVAESLYGLREGQEQIRISMSTLAARQEQMQRQLLEELQCKWKVSER